MHGTASNICLKSTLHRPEVTKTTVLNINVRLGFPKVPCPQASTHPEATLPINLSNTAIFQYMTSLIEKVSLLTSGSDFTTVFSKFFPGRGGGEKF